MFCFSIQLACFLPEQIFFTFWFQFMMLAAVGISWIIWRLFRQKRAAETMNSRLKQHLAEEQARNNEKKHLVSLLAHDLRSPLALSRFNLENLLSQKHISAQEKSDLSEIEEAYTKIDEAVHQIIEVENLERIPDTGGRMDVNAVMLEAIADAQALARKKQITIRPVSLPEPRFAQGEPELLKKVIGNLLSNAIRFSENGQSISVSLHPGQQQVELRIKDNGAGLSPAEQESIFNKQFRYAPAPQKRKDSLGLGLYLARWYVEHLQGRITVRSSPGEGAEFIVTLPASGKKT